MTTITIPQLPTIPNANISASSILPIVDTTGVPQTDKVTVGNLANFVLTQAGNLLENAFLSTYAESVTNAAQPNITSVGTLSVNTLKISGGVSGQFLRTDGAGNLSWVTGSGGGATGNIIFNNSNISTNSINTDINLIGNGTGEINISSNSHVWNFGNDANLLTPGNLIGPANANFTIYSNAGVHSFTFGDDGTFYAPDNVVLGGTSIAIGPGADALVGELTNAVLVASSDLDAYIQAVINNVSDNGSADWVALGHLGNNDYGWADMGFNSSGFGDANYTITGQGDGYLIVQTYASGQAPGGRGGNLVLATGDQGTVKDIIFATGGFLTSNEFARISHSNNALEFYDGGNIFGANVVEANTFSGTVVAFSSLPAATTTGLRAFINDANLVAVGNFGAQVSGGGSNTVPVWSNGTNWRIG
jgi:hypothetical protein